MSGPSETEALESLSLAENELPTESGDTECTGTLESNDKKEDNEKQKGVIIVNHFDDEQYKLKIFYSSGYIIETNW